MTIAHSRLKVRVVGQADAVGPTSIVGSFFSSCLTVVNDVFCAGCLQLLEILEILEISWNLKFLLEIIIIIIPWRAQFVNSQFRV